MNTRDYILEKSSDFFLKNGYNKTSMRQISNACGISVGNLTHYFPKKEALIMELHNKMMESYISRLPQMIYEDPWIGYIAVEFSFLSQVASDDLCRRLYIELIDIPSLRRESLNIHHKIFMIFLPENDFNMDSRDVYFSTVMMSSVAFHMIEQYDEWEQVLPFSKFAYAIMKTRMDSLNIPAADQKIFIESGFEMGEQLLEQVSFWSS